MYSLDYYVDNFRRTLVIVLKKDDEQGGTIESEISISSEDLQSILPVAQLDRATDF